MRFRKTGNPKNARIYVRFDEMEKNMLRQNAELCGMTLSEYVRRQALGKRIVPKVDLQILNELRRQGGSLRNLLNKVPGDSAAAKELLTAFREIVKIIDRKMEQP